MSADGLDTGERIDVGTGPGIDLQLAIPAAGQIEITFDYLQMIGDVDADPVLTGVTENAAPPHTVIGANGAVSVPYRACNLIIENRQTAQGAIITFRVNEGLRTELHPEDVIAWDKRQVYTVLITGTVGHVVFVSAW